MSTPKHGSTSGYRRGCRCLACRKANTQASARRKARREEEARSEATNIPHGLSGYNNYGCRCGRCKAGIAADARARAARGQSETRPRATRNGFIWTGSEMELASRDDLTAKQVALLLGRTKRAVRAMRERMRVEPKLIAVAGIRKSEPTS